MARLDCIGNEGLHVNYYGRIDYSSAPGEAIFINSNLILTEPAVSAGGEGLQWGEDEWALKRRGRKLHKVKTYSLLLLSFNKSHFSNNGVRQLYFPLSRIELQGVKFLRVAPKVTSTSVFHLVCGCRHLFPDNISVKPHQKHETWNQCNYLSALAEDQFERKCDFTAGN